MTIIPKGEFWRGFGTRDMEETYVVDVLDMATPPPKPEPIRVYWFPKPVVTRSGRG